MRISKKLSALLLVATSLTGCSNDDEELTVPPGIDPEPVPGCEGESYTPCDVTSNACQEAVFSTVSCLRGNRGASRPKSRIVTATEYGRELVASIGEEDAAETQAYEDAFVLLGLAEKGDLSVDSRVAVSTSTVPASYNYKTKQVTFVMPDTDAPAARSEGAYIVLAHEYTHALQDQEHDLGALEENYATSTDASLALRSLIEGEAELQENRFLAATWGLEAIGLNWAARYAAFAEWDAENLADIAPVLAIWRSFPYEAGGLYVRDAFRTGQMRAVRALFDDPPRASITVTSGVQPIPIDAAPPQPPDGYEVLAVDTLGSELFYDSMSKIGAFSSTTANLLAAEWRSDRLYLYRNRATGHVVVLWRLRFASDASTSQVLTGTSAWQSASVEGDVMIGFSNDPNGSAVVATSFENAQNGVTAPASPSTDGAAQAARLPRWLRQIVAR